MLYPLAKVYWFIVRPKTQGAGCIIECGENILLVRNTYGDGSWSFPGGGIKKEETPTQSVIREVREEVGINLANVRELGSFLYTHQYKKDTVHAFFASIKNDNVIIDRDEIKEARWFPIKSIQPDNLSAVGRRMYDLFQWAR